MKNVKIGVFGAGRGMTMISQLLNGAEGQLVAVCDKYEPALENCRKAAEEAGMTDIAYYTDFEDFFRHDMDAVILAVAHEEFRLLRQEDLDAMFGGGRKVLLDIKGILDRKAYEDAGYLYWRL